MKINDLLGAKALYPDYLNSDIFAKTQKLFGGMQSIVEEQQRLQQLCEPLAKWERTTSLMDSATSAFKAQQSALGVLTELNHPILNTPLIDGMAAIADILKPSILTSRDLVLPLAKPTAFTSILDSMQASSIATFATLGINSDMVKVFSAIDVKGYAAIDAIASTASASYAMPKFASAIQELYQGASITQTAQVLQTAIQGIKLASLDAEFKAQKQMPSPVRYMPERANYQARLNYHWNAFINDTRNEFDELFSDDKATASWFQQLIDKANALFYQKKFSFKTVAEIVFAIFIFNSFITTWMELGHIPTLAEWSSTNWSTIIDALKDWNKHLLWFVVGYHFQKQH